MKKLVVDVRMINNSGIGRYIACLMHEFRVHQDEFDLFTLGRETDLTDFSWFKKKKHIELRSKVFSLKEQIELVVKVPRTDIFWTPHFNIPILPIRTKHLVSTVHDVYQLANNKQFSLSQRLYLKGVFYAIAQKASLVFTVSDFSKSEISKYSGIKKDKIERAYLGSPELPIPNNKINENYVLYVGNVKPNKNLKNALKAFSEIQPFFPNLKFYIIGKKEGFRSGDSDIQKFISNNSYVRFTGFISDQELSNYYNSAKVFLFPSLYEGFGIPILEAMKYNIQIISSNLASIPEVGGDAIHYVNPYSVADIAKRLNEVLSGERKISNQVMQKQLELFSWEKTAEIHLNYLKKLIQ